MEKIYFYQYTDIDTLALILKNKSIKFNSLQNVDDLEEVGADDIKDFGKYTFISCWTDDEKENIALWSMYTKGMKGVRVGLYKECLDNRSEPVKEQLNKNNLVLVPRSVIFKLPEYNDYGVYRTEKVNYTDEKDKLYPKVWEPHIDKDWPLVLTRLGKNKSTQWTFQNEWRYIIYTNINNWLNEGESRDVGRKRLEEFKNIPEGIYLSIEDEAYSNMIITLGPNTTDSDRIIVDSLVEKYNKNAIVKDSTLKNKIRSKK